MQILSLRADAELAEGHSEKALEDIRLVLRLAQMQTGAVWPRQNAITFVIIALQAAWEGMAAHHWSDAQLVALDSELSKLDFLAEYRREVRGHRAHSLDRINFIRTWTRTAPWFPNMDDEYASDLRDYLLAKACYRLAPSGWWNQNRLASARAYQQALSQIDLNKRVVSKDPPAQILLKIDPARYLRLGYWRKRPTLWFPRNSSLTLKLRWIWREWPAPWNATASPLAIIRHRLTNSSPA